MCKSFLDKAMFVSRKTCKMKSCKSKIEGILIGAVVGTVAGVAIGMFANSQKGRRICNDFMCKCIDDNCGEDCN